MNLILVNIIGALWIIVTGNSIEWIWSWDKVRIILNIINMIVAAAVFLYPFIKFLWKSGQQLVNDGEITFDKENLKKSLLWLYLTLEFTIWIILWVPILIIQYIIK